MPDHHGKSSAPELVTRPRLVDDLRHLGISDDPVGIVMVHTRMSAIGRVVGGAQTVVEALLEALGDDGTVLVFTGWEDRPPYHQEDWDVEARRLYMEACPAFDPRKALAKRKHGRVPEAVRTWPGAAHSPHPGCAFAAVGPRAEWVVGGQSLDEGFGDDSPLHRLVEADGRVLMLGAPLDTITLIHHAEYLARVPEKRGVSYEIPVLVDGERVWRRIEELDSSLGAFPYEDLDLTEDAFAVIAREALAAGIGRAGTVGRTPSYLFPAARLAEYAAGWLERTFGTPGERTAASEKNPQTALLEASSEFASCVRSSALGPRVRGVFLHGSLVLGDFVEGRSDLDLLVIIDGAVREEEREAVLRCVRRCLCGRVEGADLRVVRREVTADPSFPPELELEVELRGGEVEAVGGPRAERDLAVELWVVRHHGRPLLGPHPAELVSEIPASWVDATGDAQLADWQGRPFNPRHAELMVFVACRIWRFAVERVHCGKTAAAEWALERDPTLRVVEAALRRRRERAEVEIDEDGVRALLARVRAVLAERS